MSTLFISDLHLSEDRSDLVELFFKFLRNQAIHAEALYILGDFFEMWIGDDDQTPLHQTVAQALKDLSQRNCNIYFMQGNRDFLIGKRFTKSAGMKLLKEKTRINLYGQSTLLMHGDTLCTLDTTYLKFRKKVRNPIVQFFFLRKSLATRRSLAQQYRERSQLHIQQACPEIMDVTPTEIPKVMQKYHAELLIHGHTHRPGIELIKSNNHYLKRIVLSDWGKTGHVLVCEPDGVQRSLFFS